MQQIQPLVNNNGLCIVSVFAFQSIFFSCLCVVVYACAFFLTLSLFSIQCSLLFKFDFFSLPNQTSLFFTWIIRFFFSTLILFNTLRSKSSNKNAYFSSFLFNIMCKYVGNVIIVVFRLVLDRVENPSIQKNDCKVASAKKNQNGAT